LEKAFVFCKDLACNRCNANEPESSRKQFIHRVSPKNAFRRSSVPSTFLGGKEFAFFSKIELLKGYAGFSGKPTAVG
jgi:hypothetical protein